jgi:type IV pilus assembly protein PilN
MLEVNLLPWRETLKKRQQRQRWREVISALVLASLLLSGFHYFLFAQIQAEKAHLNQLQSRLLKINKSLERLSLLYQETGYQKIPDFDLNQLREREQNILRILSKLAERIPEAVYLQELKFTEKKWLLQGSASQLEELVRFSESLKDNLRRENSLTLDSRKGFFTYQLSFESGI